jgi:hypothetical protein
MGVDANGFANLPLRAGAHRYFVNSAAGSDGAGCAGGQNPGSPLSSMAAAKACVANGSGDQILVAEGTRYAEALPNLDSQAGYSAQYPTVVQSYDPSDPLNEGKYGRAANGRRPVVNTAGVVQNVTCCSNTPASYLVIRGFDINPGNKPDMEMRLIGSGGGSNNYVLIENNIFRYTQLTIDQAQAVHDVLRKNAFFGSWSTTGHAQGTYGAGINGFVVEDNIFWHNGWKIGVGRDTDSTAGGPTIFNQAVYAQTSTSSVIRRNIIVDPSAAGCSCRGDTTITENVLIENPLAIIAGKGDNYDVHRPNGVAIEVAYNAIIGDADISSTLPRGVAITTGNGKQGSTTHHNLIVRSRNPIGPGVLALSNDAEFNQPSYMIYDSNLIYQWASTTRTNVNGGLFLAQDFSTYSNNAWDALASGSNTNIGNLSFPTSYTESQLFTALGCGDKATCAARMIETPEAGWAGKAKALLFAGYGR